MSVPCRNPLFIKSEFSREMKKIIDLKTLYGVAILYSSSQNSLCRDTELSEPSSIWRLSQSFIHQVRILSTLKRNKHRRKIEKLFVAILYSSSQNSLRIFTAARPPNWRKLSRNPLFIKSEFSRLLKKTDHHKN